MVPTDNPGSPPVERGQGHKRYAGTLTGSSAGTCNGSSCGTSSCTRRGCPIFMIVLLSLRLTSPTRTDQPKNNGGAGPDDFCMIPLGAGAQRLECGPEVTWQGLGDLDARSGHRMG